MFSKMRWGLVAVFAVMVGLSSGVNAADMTDSFDAAESGKFNKAVEIWQDMAVEGDAQAQFNLGLMYHGGLGLPRNEREAVKWYTKAAEGGYSPAQTYLVVGYEEGWFGLPQNPNKAYYWKGMLGDR
jgi:TPR repeat protein